MAQGRRQIVPFGVDERQRIARIAADLELPHAPRQRGTAEKIVPGIVLVECKHCGCTNARSPDGKRHKCEFCGKMPH
jgi:hypothetical protein